MMDLTPLDVRKKKGDFRRGIRGYEQAQVDDFLDLVADRMEMLVREASSVGERIARLEQQVADYRDREKALTEALVTAQQMREDMRTQSTREVELLRKQAEQDADRIRAEAVRMREREEQSLENLRSRQFQFLASYRKYLEQELSELAAMSQGLEMHRGGPPRPATGYPGSAATRPTPPPFKPPASADVSPPAPAQSFRDTTGPVAGPAAPVAQSPAGSGSFAAPAVPTVPTSFAASPPAAAPATHHAASDAAEDTPEAQLEEALSRWEPELGPEPDSPAEAPAEAEEPAAELALEPTDAALAIESEDDADLLLSADDEVEAVVAPTGAERVDSEEDVDLSFLEFGEDEVEPAVDPAVAAAAAAAVERDVSAALVESHGDYIDIGSAFGGDPDEIELPLEAIANAPEPARDEAEAAIGAAFDFDEFEADGLAETHMSGPGVVASAQAPVEEPDDDLAADIDFVDSLLMDAESAFEEEPSEASLAKVPPASSAEAHSGSFDGAEFDDIAAEAERTDDYGKPEYSAPEEPDPDLIDLDSFRGISTYEPPAPSPGDVSSLTLHPMFFEEEPSELDGEEREESRQDHWSA